MMENWKEYHIEDFGAISTGTTPSTKRPEYYGGNYKFISPTDLDNGKYVSTAHKFITSEGLRVSRTLPKNAILVGCIGNIGKIGMTTDEISAFNQQINAIVCNDKFIPDFIYYLLIHNKPILEKSAVKTTLPILNKGNFQKIKLTAPPQTEQRKIAYVLSTVQNAIEQQDKIIRHSTELKKALMQKLFTEGVKGEKQKQTEIGLVPESWEVKSLIDAVEYIDYGVSQAIPKTPPKNGVKIVSTADINRAGDLLYDQIRTIEVPQRTAEKLKLNEGDLLFNWRNSAELIGKSTIFHEQDEPHIFASFILRIKCGEKESHNYFLKYLMNHYREEGVFIKLARRAVNQANYNRNEISVLKIPVPPIEEQIAIAKIITQIEGKINHHKGKKGTLTDLFKTLLNELMTEQMRVHEIEFEALTKAYKIEEQPLSVAAEN
jgi:type I restriction enzyme S subunit